MKRQFVLIACLAATFGVVLGVHPEVASAHGDDGDMTVVTAEQAGPTEIRLMVGILYSNDDDPATEATVSVTGTGPDGATLEETPLPRQDGAKYGATLEVTEPGTWQLTITSTDPASTATASVEVTAQTTTTPAPSTTEVVATTAAAPQSTTDDEVATTAVAEDDDSGDNTAVIVVVAVLVVALLIGGGLALRARTTPPSQ